MKIESILREEYSFQYKLYKIDDRYYIKNKDGKKEVKRGIKDLHDLKELVIILLNKNNWFSKFNKKEKEKILNRYIKELKKTIK